MARHNQYQYQASILTSCEALMIASLHNEVTFKLEPEETKKKLQMKTHI